MDNTYHQQIQAMAEIACAAVHSDADKKCSACAFDHLCDTQNICEALYDANFRRISWVEVNDHLPENGQTVLVYASSTGVVSTSTFCVDAGGKSDWLCPIRLGGPITHWCPILPFPKSL